ncbi:glycosyltransferase family 1 protein [Candidatus Bathyarchaeota archaeon]|nr:MAG: glycosyltransferase family 1 protein [Candidatus Bathyarchaeota archaeon]
MTRVLVSSAAYVLSDYLLSSEGISCYQLLKNLGKFNYSFDAVSEFVRVRSPLKNANFHQVGSFKLMPKSSLVTKYLAHTEFITRSCLKCMRILKDKEITIVHHMFPAVNNQSFSLLALMGKTRKHPFVVGPLSAHYYTRPRDERTIMGLTSKLHRKTIQKADAIITVNQQVRKLYEGIVDNERIRVIPLGVDTDVFSPAEKTIHKNSYEILYAGYLYRLKGVEYLIRALALVAKEQRDVRLRVVGEGPDRSRLVALAKSFDLEENVRFEGFVPHTQIVRYYQHCNIFCFPTLGEPFGKVVLEAMACGKPVIASNVGGPADIIEDKRTGFLIPPAQPGILAETILGLLVDQKKRKKIGANARTAIAQSYSWESIAEKYHKLYSNFA